MRKFFIFVVASIAYASLAGQSSDNSLLIRITEAQINATSQGGVSSDCIVVKTDGQFHLERRLQQLPDPNATVRTYDSSLTDMQLQWLRNILSEDRMQKLPAFVMPDSTGPEFLRRGVAVDFIQDGVARTAGYIGSAGAVPENQPANASSSVKKSREDAEIALQPLMDWFHGVEETKLSPSQPKWSACSPESSKAE